MSYLSFEFLLDTFVCFDICWQENELLTIDEHCTSYSFWVNCFRIFLPVATKAKQIGIFVLPKPASLPICSLYVAFVKFGKKHLTARANIAIEIVSDILIGIHTGHGYLPMNNNWYM